MRLQTFGSLSNTFLSVGAGALTQSTDYSFLALPVAIAAGAIWIILAVVFLYRNRVDARFWISKVEPAYIVILGLIIALCGMGWQFYRGPKVMTVTVAAELTAEQIAKITAPFQTQIDSLKLQLAQSTKGNPEQRQSELKQRYTSTQLEVRQQAVRDLTAAMTGPVRTALLAVQKIQEEGIWPLTWDKTIQDRLSAVQKQASGAFNNLNEVLARYQPYKDICSITNVWRYDAIITQSKQLAELLQLILPEEMGKRPRQPMLDGERAWRGTASGFSDWYTETMQKITAKSLELEDANAK